MPIKRRTPDIDLRWFSLEGEDLCQSLYSLVSTLAERDGWRRRQDRAHARMYGDLPVLGFAQTNAAPPGWGVPGMNSPARAAGLTLNVVKSCVDAATAKITKSRILPMFLTNGGDWSAQRKAKSLNAFTQGIFEQVGLYEVAPLIFRDACVYGTGCLKIYPENDEIRVDRIHSSEIVVDPLEALYGDPRNLYQFKLYDRQTLTDTYPDHAAAIERASTTLNQSYWLADGLGLAGTWAGSMADMVTVVEAWHLPSSPDAEDGRHVICVDTVTLSDETYEFTQFPFVFLRWTPPLAGFWGEGLARSLAPIQFSINKNLSVIERCLELMAIPTILVESGSKVAKGAITNDIGRIITWIGTPPQFVMPPAVPPELIQHVEYLYTKAFLTSGISQLTAQSQKPAGLNAAVALQTYSDIESERFSVVAMSWARMFIDAAEQMIGLARSISAKSGGYKVVSPGPRGTRPMDWSDIDLHDDVFIIHPWATNELAVTPAGRDEQLSQLTTAGGYSVGDAKRLLGFPDLTREEQLESAPHDNIERQIEIMLDDGRYCTPEPYQDLQTALRLVQSAYLNAQDLGAPEDRLDLLRQYLADAKSLLDQQAAPAAPAPGAPPPGPSNDNGPPPPPVPQAA